MRRQLLTCLATYQLGLVYVGGFQTIEDYLAIVSQVRLWCLELLLALCNVIIVSILNWLVSRVPVLVEILRYFSDHASWPIWADHCFSNFYSYQWPVLHPLLHDPLDRPSLSPAPASPFLVSRLSFFSLHATIAVVASGWAKCSRSLSTNYNRFVWAHLCLRGEAWYEYWGCRPREFRLLC